MNILIWIGFYASVSTIYAKYDKSLSRNELVNEVSLQLGIKNNAIFTPQDVDKLMIGLNFRKCDENEKSKSCNLCYSYEDFLQLFKESYYNKNLTYPEFMEVLSGGIYLLTSRSQNSVECKKFQFGVLTVSSFYSELQNKYGGHKTLQQYFDNILRDIDATLGTFLNGDECFSTQDVINTANVSGDKFNESDFHYASAFITLQLLKKNCIKYNNPSISSIFPSPQFFVSEILKSFGNETQMSHENFKSLLKKLGIGRIANVPSIDEKNLNKKKRLAALNRKRRSANDFEKCFSAEELLEIFKIPKGKSIGKENIQDICPSLIQQTVSGYCTINSEGVNTSHTSWESWVATMISVFIISLGSLLGLFATPIIKKKWFSLLLLFVISMGVGVLAGDGILHLLPHAFGFHKHDSSDAEFLNHDLGNHGEHDVFAKDSFLWKCSLFLAGAYLFFAFEIIMHACGAGHSHSQFHSGHSHGDERFSTENTKNEKQEEKYVIRNEYQETLAKELEVVSYKPSAEKFPNDSTHKKDLNSEINFIEVPNAKSLSNKIHDDGSRKEEKISIVSKKALPIKEFKSVVWMIFVGDAIHNFMDGVAVGTAFSDSFPAGLNGGISTSIAILLHELPHELGDFAILLAAGLSVKQACIMHFISSITAFAGGCLGVSLGTEWNAAPWIFSLTAGLFLYIALVDMLPEVLHSSLLKTKPVIATFLSLLGMLVGFAIMFCLAAWEEDLEGSL